MEKRKTDDQGPCTSKDIAQQPTHVPFCTDIGEKQEKNKKKNESVFFWKEISVRDSTYMEML